MSGSRAGDVNLAILVVYLFDDETEPMIGVHLDHIRRNTKVPFKIYGNVTLLSERHRQRIAREPGVEVVLSSPEKPEQGPQDDPRLYPQREHRHHMLAVRDRARADGATHFVTLHPDSFPARSDWVASLVAGLEAGEAFAFAAPYAYSGCMFWSKAWDDEGAPLGLEHIDGSNPEKAAFFAAHPDYDQADNGVGFAFHAWRTGRRWRELRPKDRVLWGDMIVHLVGGSRLTHRNTLVRYRKSPYRRLYEIVRPLLKGAVPPSGRRALRALAYRAPLPNSLRHRLVAAIQEPAWDLSKPGRDGTPLDKRQQIALLVEDPEAFVEAARGAA